MASEAVDDPQKCKSRTERQTIRPLVFGRDDRSLEAQLGGQKSEDGLL